MRLVAIRGLERFHEISDYMGQMLGADIVLGRNEIDLASQAIQRGLADNYGLIQSSLKPLVIFGARNFENSPVYNAHVYAQGICENFARDKYLPGLTKKVIILTHVDDSKGDEEFRSRVRRSLGSQRFHKTYFLD